MDVLIIEDEQLASKRLIKLIKAIDDTVNIIDVIDSVESSIEWFQNNEHPDLIFLDIQLSDGLSFNIFNKVEVNSSVIFTTAFDEFALQAFELNSVDYLLKPIDESKLKISIQKYKKVKQSFNKNEINFDSKKLLQALQKKEPKYKTRFLVNKGSSLIVIDIEDVAYFYTEDKLVFIITNDNKRYSLNTTLDKLEKELEPQKLYRANRQYLVSVQSIKEIHNHFNYKLKLDLVPKPESEDVVISKLKVSDFKNWISTQ